MYDVIVVGAGHAGLEASIASAKMQKNTLLITGNLDKVASLPCNPSIGGPAKGVVVREVDALGGVQGKIADKAQIQIKLLNPSKGPAMRAFRAQVDKVTYPQIALDFAINQENLELLEDFVHELIIEDGVTKGIVLENGKKIYSKTVVITTGTYLSSAILKGTDIEYKGPEGEKTTKGISAQLKNHNIEMMRLKTGTPPRLYKEGIDFSVFTPQPGDTAKYTFSHDDRDFNEDAPIETCYLLHTTLETHRIINENLHLSSMYSGAIEGQGPRYCPSIEDKIVRFNTQPRHQVFLEPESMYLDEIYVQGFSTSFPEYLQDILIKTLPGLENAKIAKYGYAIEYDAINPIELYPSLEAKKIKNLFCAGQINGTSGYEEAAGQGIMAGINAALKVDEKDPFVLGRDEAYIGVMIDDLVTKGVEDPYRLLTSRAEHRLFIRNDNADLRLTEHGFNLGTINEDEYALFNKKKVLFAQLLKEMDEFFLFPNEEGNKYLESRNSAVIHEKISLTNLLKRPEINKEDIIHFLGDKYCPELYEKVEIHVKYSGYVKKAQRKAERVLRLDDKKIPDDIDYEDVHNLSYEAREKMGKVRPKTIGQASRINGVNPTDISLLLLHLESRGRQK